MAPSSRDRLSVDLRGLKAALLERAKALGVSPSALVRTLLCEALGRPVQAADPMPATGSAGAMRDRVRLSLRMNREHARATLEAARRAGLAPGDFVGGLVLGVPVLVGGADQPRHLASLTASSAELSTLSRHLHRLSQLLSQADAEAARPYRQMLDGLAVEVRGHLQLAATALADLQQQQRRANAAAHGRDRSGELQ